MSLCANIAGNIYANDELLGGLATLTALEQLDLSTTPVSDQPLLSAVEKLSQLRRLNLAGTKIGNSLGAALPDSLQELDVSRTRVGDFFTYDLKSCPRLKLLVVAKTEVTPEAVAALEKSLPKCRIELE